jgi:hypothetical protein
VGLRNVFFTSKHVVFPADSPIGGWNWGVQIAESQMLWPTLNIATQGQGTCSSHIRFQPLLAKKTLQEGIQTYHPRRMSMKLSRLWLTVRRSKVDWLPWMSGWWFQHVLPPVSALPGYTCRLWELLPIRVKDHRNFSPAEPQGYPEIPRCIIIFLKDSSDMCI